MAVLEPGLDDFGLMATFIAQRPARSVTYEPSGLAGEYCFRIIAPAEGRRSSPQDSCFLSTEPKQPDLELAPAPPSAGSAGAGGDGGGALESLAVGAGAGTLLALAAWVAVRGLGIGRRRAG